MGDLHTHDPNPGPVERSALSEVTTTMQEAVVSAVASSAIALPPELDRRFEAVVFDWDGTAVANRDADGTAMRGVVEELCSLGFHVAVVTGTNIKNVDPQLAARPVGPGCLYLCLNRGSEVYVVGASGPELLWRREASEAEERALDEAARLSIERLEKLGLRAEVVSERLNRRKVDIIPEAAWADPPKARIGELLSAVEQRLSASGLGTLADVVDLCEQASRDAGLDDPKITSDVKHIEIGLTDKADSARWILHELAGLGVVAADVLVAGDELGPIGGLPGSDSFMLVPESFGSVAFSVGVEPNGVPEGVLHVPGGPPTFVSVLEDQVARRRAGELPHVNSDPEWSVVVYGLDPVRERVRQSVLSISDGLLGTSGTTVLADPASGPLVLPAGVYDGRGAASRLLGSPIWNRLAAELTAGSTLRRVVDLRSGLAGQEVVAPDGHVFRAVFFSSLARPGTVVLRAEGREALSDPGSILLPPSRRKRTRAGEYNGRHSIEVAGDGGGVAAAASEQQLSLDPRRLERIGAFVTDGDQEPPLTRALDALDRAEDAGFERLLGEQRAAWGDRWADADIRIEGDPELQQGVRFALFHLLGSAAETGEAAVGARGLTGHSYRGHVFWDTDIFVLPFLAATRPAAARAVLEYRLRRLDAARLLAHASGRRGARFPWESARTGRDVTPKFGRLRTGETFPIFTGELEEHVVSDIAWAASCYVDWTGDEAFAEGPGRELLVETARYWASRIERDGLGSGHISHVIGPDEYHEDVDDNAYTNVMARWNLRRAAAVSGALVDDGERAEWLRIADGIVDNYDERTGLYEQFKGFYDLAPLIIADLYPVRPVHAEVLFGRDEIHRSQIVKQTDVLMLHHLIPDEVAPGSLDANLSFYEPRTAHGSSLSPAVHASLLARAGRLDEAVDLLRRSSRLDLDDLTQTSQGGLHVATMGGVWQALAFGFAGLRPAADSLVVDPRLPEAWDSLELRVRFRGSRVRVRIEHDAVELEAELPTSVVLAGSDPVAVHGTVRLPRTA